MSRDFVIDCYRIVRMKKTGYAKIVLIAILLVTNGLVWIKILSFEARPPLKVVFLDIGQGDSIFIETKFGNQLLIDGGRNESLIRKLSKEISAFDKSIDVVLATHPDADHIGGLPVLLERFDVDVYVESGNESETLVYKSLEKILSEKKIKRILGRRGLIIDLGGGIFAQILFPDRDVSKMESNLASIVLKITYGDVSFMLSGDSPVSIESYLTSLEGNNLQSEVLKLGHHGSRTSTSPDFLNLVSPRYSVVSAGLGNRYGHPHKEVISMVSDFGSEILETSKLGSVTFYSDGEKVWRK